MYPLPRISDTLQQLEGFQGATSLDLNMGYYHIVLSDKSSDMCTIVTEFGKYRYKKTTHGSGMQSRHLPSQNIWIIGRHRRNKILHRWHLSSKRGMFEEHLEQLNEIFKYCQKTGLKMNGKKCRFGLNEIGYLGYIVTPSGVKPNPKKIQAIMRRLIGMVQYYRDLWPKRSHYCNPSLRCHQGKRVRRYNGLQSWSLPFKQ